jgi:diguanylate cyclase (GGDEF)-like protein
MLDIRTLYFLLTLSTIVAGISVLLMHTPEPDRRKSATAWAVGNFLVAAGLFLVGLRNHIPLWPSAVLGNSLLMSGFLLFYWAYTALLRPAPRLRYLVMLALTYTIFYHWLLTYSDTTIAQRIGIVSLAVAVLAVFMIRSAYLGQDSYTRSPARLMLAFYGIALVTGILRGVHSVFFESGAQQIFEPTTVQVVSFLGYFFALIGAGIAYVLTLGALTYRDLAIIANNDMLTGVRNRRNFLEMAERDLALAQRMWRPITVLMLDLDHFKRINDNYGHLAGDEVLRRFGDIVRRCIREVDLAGRYGGEEFCIVLADTAPETAHNTAERIRSELAAEEISFNGLHIPVSVSIGIAGMHAGDSRNIQQLLSAADLALYAAKGAGRNCIRFGHAT